VVVQAFCMLTDILGLAENFKIAKREKIKKIKATIVALT
jgi:hypothetical protein